MITNKKQLRFFCQADMMMNRGRFKNGFLRRVYDLFCPDYVMRYLNAMRHYAYYKNTPPGCTILDKALNILLMCYWHFWFFRYGYKTGFSIGHNCLGYGATLHHYGTVVIGSNNRIGNYACIHTSTCIIANGSQIGDGLFLGSGAKIIKKVTLGNNVWVGANSVVTASFSDNILIAGSPAEKKKEVKGEWCLHLYNSEWRRRFECVEKLKKEMYIG